MASIFQWFDFELESLKGIIRLDKVCIDNYVFRIHYKLTVPLLITLSTVQICREYLGDPIDCVQGDDVPEDLLDTFCWIHSTFSLPDAWNKKVGKDVPYPGVDTFIPGHKKIYHTYYQWVCFVLFIQSLLFYTPRYLWKMWESGRMASLVMDFNKPVLKPAEKDENKVLLVKYLRSHMNRHEFYVIRFLIAETLNFVNVVGQMYLIDDFLGGSFSTYGIDVLRFTDMDQQERLDPMVKIFPRMTKCTFHRFGSSGDVQKYDTLCILPLNVFNEKIYVFLWFFFIILSVVSGAVLVYRMVLIFWPTSRFLILRGMCPVIDKRSLDVVLSHSQLGDWFVFNLLCKNLDPLYFREILDDLAKELRQGDRSLEKQGTEFSELIPF